MKICGVLLILMCAILSVCLNSAAAQAKHGVTIEDLVALKDVDWHMEVSPDGATLAYVLDETIWLVGLKQGSIPKQLIKGSMPRWSPNGKQLAFYSTVSGQRQLWIINPQTRATTQLTQLPGGIDPDPRTRFSGWIGDPLRYSWSPDGQTIAFVSRIFSAKLSAIKPGVGSSDPLVLSSASSSKPQALSGVFQGPSSDTIVSTPGEIFLMNVSSGEVRQLTNDGAQNFNPSWSPDGTTLVSGSAEGRSIAGDREVASNIYTIEIATGRKKALTRGTGIKRLPCWSPDGKLIAYLGSERYGLRSIYVVPITGLSKPRLLTETLQRGVIYFYWSTDSKSLFAAVQDGVSWPIVKIDINGSYERVTKSEAVFWPFTTTKDNGLVWARSDGSTHEAIQVEEAFSGRAFTLVETNPQIRGWKLGKQEIVSWRNSRGEPLEGILITPSDQTGPYPLIVDLYSTRTNRFMGSRILANQALVSHGYAVFFPNYRSHHNWMNYTRDAAYNLIARGERGAQIMMDDIMSGLRLLVARQIANADQLGVYGYSNGATAVNYLLTKISIFKCGVSAEGFADWTLSYFLETDTAYTAATMADQTPWENPRAYTELSPVYHLDRIRTPMLLAVGDKGTPARLLSYISMFNGLSSLGREVTLVRYRDEPHVFSGRNLLDYWHRVFEFFDTHLEAKDKGPH